MAGRWGHLHKGAPPGLGGSSRAMALGPVLGRARRPRRRRIGPLTVALALVLVLLGAASVASRPLAGPRHPVPARRAARTTPARPTPRQPAGPTSAYRGGACPPPAPIRRGPGQPAGGPGRRALSAAVRHSPWVRSQLPPSRQAGKTVALTFDDGPDPRFTPRILAILARAHVPATFFMLGSQAAAHPDLVRRVARTGQAVGGHTWHHARLDRLTWAGVAAEVDCTDRLLARLAGRPVRLVRPPDRTYNSSVVGLLAARGVALTLWTVDARDWTRPGVGRIRATVARELRPGAIILLHDGGGDRSQTVAALPGVLGLLQARGYRAVALPTPRGRCCSTLSREPGKLPQPAHNSRRCDPGGSLPGSMPPVTSMTWTFVSQRLAASAEVR
jgi:peptidoglycan-N-acetylglucosamine deacetylase